VKKIVLTTAVVLFFVSCGGAPQPAKPDPVTNPAIQEQEVIISYQDKDIGVPIPAWVRTSELDLQNSPDYKDFYVFKFMEEGQDLRGAQLAAERLQAAPAIASQVNQRVQAKFVGAEVGDRNLMEAYMENVVKSLSDAQLNGLRIQNFWTKVRVTDPDGRVRDVFRVRVLATVPKQTLDTLIRRALDGTERERPLTEGQRAARARVRQAIEEGF